MGKLERLVDWISMMAWMCKGMKIDMRVKVDMTKVDMMEVGMRLKVWICRMMVDMRMMVWICRMLKVGMMEVDMMV